jgi:glycosyltransferase involved in cell wall biosynthesis
MPRPLLLVCQELTQGGSERQLVEIARALDRTRFTPHVACLRPHGIRYEELRAAGIPVATFPLTSFAKPIELLRAAARLGRYIQHHGIQLVHSFDTPGNIFAVPAARAFQTPVVLSSQRAFRDLAGPRWRHALRLTDRVVDAVVVNCRRMEEHLVEDERVPRGRIRLCYNGIDTRVFYPAAVLRQEPLRGARLVIGVVCALRPEKGVPVLLQAFARICQPGMRLVVVGSGAMRPALEAMRGELGLAESCLFIPSTKEVAPWLRSFDIFVLPSFSEALSNALMEAMACGCACAASSVGGNPELVQEGETGLLFRPGDPADLARALAILIAQPDLRQTLAAAAAGFIRAQFTQERAASNMGAIYDSFLST